ncbi:hypothetical protein K438DRAFT_1819245 [Mycena galopus ATCC 62051]|nr:hypothetical protein K438DRAFT_1819245 [Mycena galopus ATCC 62051]
MPRPMTPFLSKTNSAFHNTLNQTLYDRCASFRPLGILALLFAVEHELERTFNRLIAAGIGVNHDYFFASPNHPHSLLHIAAKRGYPTMIVKLLGSYGGEMAARVHARKGRRTALDYAASRGHSI